MQTRRGRSSARNIFKIWTRKTLFEKSTKAFPISNGMMRKMRKVFLSVALVGISVFALTSFVYAQGTASFSTDVQCSCSGDNGAIQTSTATDASGCYSTAQSKYATWSCTVYTSDGQFIESKTGTGSGSTGGDYGGGGDGPKCSSGQFVDFGSSVSGTCVTTCSGTQVGDSTDGYCHTSCPSGHNCSTTGSTGTTGTTNTSGSSSGDPGLSCNGTTCTYVPLEPLPGLSSSAQNGSDFVAYINGLVLIFVIIGAMLAVVRFSIGGVMYMTSDVAGTRNKAKSQMWASVWGIVLLVSAVLILNTINPNIVNLSIITDLTKLKDSGGSTVPASSTNTGSNPGPGVIPNCNPQTTNCASG